MFEFKGLVASSAKKYNENAGFASPLGKNIVSRKNIFSDKAKVVLGDLKNTALNIQTPKTEKAKHNVKNLFLSTPKFKDAKTNELFGLASPKLSSKSSTNFENQWDPYDTWNEKLALSDDKFKLLFLEPNENLAPPTPKSVEHEPPHDFIELPSVLETPNYGSVSQQNDDDIPPIGMDFLDIDFWDDIKNKDEVLTTSKF